MLTVSHQPGTSCYLCALTVPKGDDGIFSALERAISTLDLKSSIPIATVTDYPTIRSDIDVKVDFSDGVEIPVQVDTTETHFIYTFHSYRIDNETVNQNLNRTFTAIQYHLVQVGRRFEAAMEATQRFRRRPAPAKMESLRFLMGKMGTVTIHLHGETPVDDILITFDPPVDTPVSTADDILVTFDPPVDTPVSTSDILVVPDTPQVMEEVD